MRLAFGCKPLLPLPPGEGWGEGNGEGGAWPGKVPLHPRPVLAASLTPALSRRKREQEEDALCNVGGAAIAAGWQAGRDARTALAGRRSREGAG